MSLFVDSSVWSLAMRRDPPSMGPEVKHLERALAERQTVVTTGLVLQELLQGFHGAKAWDSVVERLSVLPMLVPDREDHIEAAALRSRCRRKGVQVGTIDALFAWLCLRYGLAMLSTDRDFLAISRVEPLELWN